jgi:uncharacterized RDD family membrane protein YckC
MGVAEKYLQDVLNKIQAPPGELKRIELDLRNHLQDLNEELGDELSLELILDRMGTPEEVAGEFMSNIKLQFAGFWLRSLAFLIDMAAVKTCATLLALPAVGIFHFYRFDLSYATLIFALMTVPLAVAAAGLLVLYFPILEGRYGTTLGKHLLGLHVVKETGAPIDYREAFLRRIPYYFKFLPVDMLFIFFSEKKQRAFDMIAKTVVIKNG